MIMTMIHISQANRERIHKASMRSSVATAINDDHPPDLVVELKPNTSATTLAGIVADLRRFGSVEQPHFSSCMGTYSIELTPYGRTAGERLLRYWETNSHIDYIWVNGTTEAASSRDRTLDSYLR
jgi:DNA-binding transcriptional regulator YiaG